MFRSTFFATILMGMVGCGDLPHVGPTGMGTAPSTQKGGIAVSNTYLECVVRDLLGPDVSVATLAGPGMCPGHFDIRPSLFSRLAQCEILIRFDFQASLDARLQDRTDRPMEIVPVELEGGMCQPDSYLTACRQVADRLVALGKLDRRAAEGRLDEVARKCQTLADWARAEVEAKHLAGSPVVTSAHQASFCRWLGLEVVADFSSADTARPRAIDEAVRAGDQAKARLVIANLPEGRRLADALAKRLGARVVLFGNFPESGGYDAFERLVRGNVERLVNENGP